MTLLSMEHISRENPNCEMSSVSSLQLSHRALTDVSCLSNFLNLERLDLSYNCLTSLEGLSACVNLKWLQVLENKLVTLKGIESLSKLTVLNAGRNKLEKMDEICVLSNLRALILNDNNISSICSLDQMKYLNTLVLSRNPIHAIGNSLKKVTSMTKLSLSHCKLQTIGSSSLVGCEDLKEARFSHNEITALPEELAKNIKLRTLDIGNNLIEKFSEVKVLSTLRNLKSLNLLGNPIAENEKIVKKVKRLLPNIRIFNAKPSESSDMASERGSLHPTKADSLLQISSGIEDNKKRKKRQSNTELLEKNTDAQKRNSSSVEESIDSKADVKKPEKNSSVGKVGGKFKDIDDEESPFVDLVFSGKTLEDLESEKKGRETVGDSKLVKHGKKVKKRTKTMNSELSALQFLSSKHEVGMGGHSTWDG